MVTKEPAKRIRHALIDRGISGAALARMIGYSPGYFRLVVCGSKASGTAREAIEKALGIEIWSRPAKLRSRGGVR